MRECALNLPAKVFFDPIEAVPNMAPKMGNNLVCNLGRRAAAICTPMALSSATCAAV